MSLWLRPTLALFFWVVCCPLRLLAATTVVQSTDAAIEYTGVWEVVMPNSSTAYAVSNMSGSKAVSTSTSTVSSTLPSTTFTSTTSSTSILATSSTSPPDSTPTQGHITTLSKGVTIGGGIAGTLGFLFLVGGVCWWGQRRGRRKRQGSSGSSDSRPPLGMHAATSQVTLGSDPFASERLRIGLPIYIPVGSASDLSNGGSQYTPTQGPSRAGHLSEKYGMDGAPLHSPVSTSNLLDSPNYPHYAPASPAPPRFDTPMQVRRMDVDERRRSADGGVRIAGGRPGQRVDSEDPDDSFLDLAWRKSIGSTLPPAYDFD